MKIFILRLLLVALLPFCYVSLSAQDVSVQAVDSVIAIPDTLLFKIQKAQSAITEVNAANKKGYNTAELRNVLSNIQKNIKPLQSDFKNSKSRIETKSLISYGLILKDASDRLSSLRNVLLKSNAELQRMSEQVIALTADSSLSIMPKDDAKKKLYEGQLQD
jgi:potassium efflux system protein